MTRHQRAYLHVRSALYVAWLLIEPAAARSVAEVRGAMRGQQAARRP